MKKKTTSTSPGFPQALDILTLLILVFSLVAIIGIWRHYDNKGKQLERQMSHFSFVPSSGPDVVSSLDYYDMR